MNSGSHSPKSLLPKPGKLTPLKLLIFNNWQVFHNTCVLFYSMPNLAIDSVSFSLSFQYTFNILELYLHTRRAYKNIIFLNNDLILVTQETIFRNHCLRKKVWLTIMRAFDWNLQLICFRNVLIFFRRNIMPIWHYTWNRY